MTMMIKQDRQKTVRESHSVTSLIRDIYCGPEVLFETCVTMKFVDDDDNDDAVVSVVGRHLVSWLYGD